MQTVGKGMLPTVFHEKGLTEYLKINKVDRNLTKDGSSGFKSTLILTEKMSPPPKEDSDMPPLYNNFK